MKVKFNPYKKWDILKIEWIDSSQHTSWQFEEDIDLDEKFLQCETIGYYLDQTKNSFAVCQSFTPLRDKKHLSEIMQIPKVAIKKITILK